jgi:hypothetical protein
VLEKIVATIQFQYLDTPISEDTDLKVADGTSRRNSIESDGAILEAGVALKELQFKLARLRRQLTTAKWANPLLTSHEMFEISP